RAPSSATSSLATCDTTPRPSSTHSTVPSRSRALPAASVATRRLCPTRRASICRSRPGDAGLFATRAAAVKEFFGTVFVGGGRRETGAGGEAVGVAVADLVVPIELAGRGLILVATARERRAEGKLHFVQLGRVFAAVVLCALLRFDAVADVGADGVAVLGHA